MSRVDPRAYFDSREVPRYSVREVALYFRLRPRTVHTWFFGRSYKVNGREKFWSPLAVPATHNPHGDSLSFYNLAEAHILSACRHDFSIAVPSIREAIDVMAKQYESPRHPLLAREFETHGRQLFVRELQERGEQLIVRVSKGIQLAFPDVLAAYLKRIVRDKQEFPTRVFPVLDHDLTKKPIVIAFGIAASRPTIAGTGVRVAAIWNRHQAGDSPEELADDYGIDEEKIRKAIDYFTLVKAA